MNKLLLFICTGIGIACGINANLLSLVLPQVAQDLMGTASVIGGYAIASFLAGWMFGGMAFGFVCDLFGRKKAMMLSIAILSVSSFLTAFVTDAWLLYGMRFCSGFGVGGAMVSAALFLTASKLSRNKTVAIGVLVASYQGGVLLSGALMHLVSDWRIAFALGLSPLVLALLVWVYFTEPENMQQKEMTSDVSYKRNFCIGSVLFGCLLIGYWASLAWTPLWIQQISAGGHEKNTATVFHGLFAIIGCLMAGALIDRLGQTVLITGSFLGAFVCSLIMFLGNTHFGKIIYFEYALLGLCIGIAQSALYIYLPTLFPANIRGRSVAFCLNAGRLVTVLAVLSVAMIVSFFEGYGQALSCFALLYLLGAICSSLKPLEVPEI